MCISTPKAERIQGFHHMNLEINTLAVPETTIMGGKECYKPGCTKISEDDCMYCGKPVCNSHGRPKGDYFACKECT